MTIDEFRMLYPRSEVKFKAVYKSPDDDIYESFETELDDEPEVAYKNACNKMEADHYSEKEHIYIEAVVIWREDGGKANVAWDQPWTGDNS